MEGDLPHDTELVSSLARVFSHLIEESELNETLDQLMRECRLQFSSDAASVVLGKTAGTHLRVVACSSNGDSFAERVRFTVSDGPVLECVTTGRAVTVGDIREVGDRWPLFTAQAVQQGFRSVHVIPLQSPAGTIGALTLFDSIPKQFEEKQLLAGQAFADAATISIVHHRRMRELATVAEQLQGALNSRVIIEQAKGIVSHALNVDMDDAFAWLRRYARVQGRKLRDVAAEVTQGQLPVIAQSPDRDPPE